jgi:hypothetical protein
MLQLETLIKKAVAKSMSLPENLVVSVWLTRLVGKSCVTALTRWKTKSASN